LTPRRKAGYTIRLGWSLVLCVRPVGWERPRRMANVTIRILEGLERGRVFADLPTPVTIGREDDNDVQLNDDRTSRFHAKLQDDGGKVILTDLDSTNGTRVNGHPVQMKVLQPGDLVSIGRCVLLFGNPTGWRTPGDDQGDLHASGQTAVFDDEASDDSGDDIDFHVPPRLDIDREVLFPAGAPPVPADLRPLQLAQVSDMLAYLHDRIGSVVSEAAETENSDDGERAILCRWDAWQRLVQMQAALAVYLRKLAEPD
jgi:hypothetical protein